jgi:hypothetical protein
LKGLGKVEVKDSESAVFSDEIKLTVFDIAAMLDPAIERDEN